MKQTDDIINIGTGFCGFREKEGKLVFTAYPKKEYFSNNYLILQTTCVSPDRTEETFSEYNWLFGWRDDISPRELGRSYQKKLINTLNFLVLHPYPSFDNKIPQTFMPQVLALWNLYNNTLYKIYSDNPKVERLQREMVKKRLVDPAKCSAKQPPYWKGEGHFHFVG